MGALSMSQMLLEIRNATKLYAQRRTGGTKKEVIALQEFNLSIPKQPASIITIAGESGSGKTTFIRMLCGLLTPDAGRGARRGHHAATGSNLGATGGAAGMTRIRSI
jgi:ABC-type glutathione transport system ATPase component